MKDMTKQVRNRGRELVVLLMGLYLGVCGLNCFGATWQVNVATCDDTAAAADATGATAFATIQAAINRASANDVIQVAPGVYNEGVYTDADGGRNRVYINKKLTIESTGDRTDTVIEGYSDPESEHHGMTDGVSVRCVWMTKGAVGSVLKGFTLRNGATQWNSGAENPKALSCGGGFYDEYGGNSTSCLVDCSIENCSGQRGGGMRYGRAIRTYFRNNYASHNGAAAREAQTYFCDFSGHTGTGDMLAWPAAIIHCSMGNNAVRLIGHSTLTVRNTMLLPGGGGTSDNQVTWSGCVTTTPSISGTVQDTTLLGVFGAGAVAPLVNDFRPLAGGPAAGRGVVANLANIPEAYRDKDIDGNPVPTEEGELSPGAHQVPVTPQGGQMIFVKPTDIAMTVNGIEVLTSNYVYSVVWPTQYLLQVTSKRSDQEITRVNLKVNGTSNVSDRPALTDDNKIWLTGPTAGTTCEYGAEKGSVKWIDANSEAETEDGSAAAPFKTIQAAVDAYPGWAAVFKVKKGIYDTGGGVERGHNCRVAIHSGGYLRIIGVDGAEETFIVGAADPDAPEEAYGCGANAMRCVASGANGYLQGFTLTGGHSAAGESLAVDSTAVRGGAVCAADYNGSSSGFVLGDCIISNNVAWRAAIANGGRLVRCLVVSNRTVAADGATINAIAANSLFIDNPVGVGSGTTTGGTIGRDTRSYNCTVVEHDSAKGTPYGAAYIYNCIFSAKRNNSVAATVTKGVIVDGFGSTGNGRFKINPFFVDADAGDYRVLATSPAIGIGESVDVANWWLYASMDFAGNPYSFARGVTAGAFQVAEPVVTDWYVDAVNGNDANAGDAPTAAKRTLAAALSQAVRGATVHVAPGTYADGDMIQPTAVKNGCTPSLRARAYVPSDVTLVADGAAAETVIDGSDEIRCAFVETNATLKGFTLTRGATGTENIEDDNNHGAGVLSRNYTANIEDCVITACHAPRAAGGRYGTYRRCRFMGNTATVNGSASRDAYYYGCFFDGNVGTHVLNFFSCVSGCTFGPNNVRSVGGATESLGSAGGTIPVSCSMFCGGTIAAEVTFTNCAYLSGMTFPSKAVISETCVAATRLDLDVNGAPVVGANDAIDAGDLSLWTLGETDAAGNPRITNGRMDIGCYEASWLSRYSQDLMTRGQLTVTNATPYVQEVGPEIYLPDGALDATLADVTGLFSLPIRITGNGTLSVTIDGVKTDYTGPQDVFSVDKKFALGTHALSFAYTPGANDVGGAYLGRIGRNDGLQIIFR